jgi:hypothetical protein
MILIGSAVFMILLLTSPQEYQRRIYPVIGLMVLSVASHAILRVWGALVAVRVLILGGWMLATYAGMASEGVRTPILAAYPIMLVFSGWMLGARYCIALFVARTWGRSEPQRLCRRRWWQSPNWQSCRSVR